MQSPHSEPAPEVRAEQTPSTHAESYKPSRFATDFVPWLSSLLVHAGVAVLGLTLASVVLSPIAPNQKQEVIPAAATGLPDPEHIVPTTGAGASQIPADPTQDEIETATNGTSRDRGKSIDFQAAAGSAGGGPEVASIIGTGGGTFGVTGDGTGGDGTGPRGRGGEMARFGPKQPGGGTHLFPPSKEAKRVIFACDASGSMINKIAALRQEMNKAISKLNAGQAFNIIFFQDIKSLSLDPNSMILANSNNRRRASVFLNEVSTVGATNPIPSLEAAFRQEPELIYLLTDGDFPDNNSVLNRIRELNKGKKVRINTIAFTDDRGDEVDFLKLLETIANENGGAFRHVKLSELE